jgi:hypothetical protein
VSAAREKDDATTTGGRRFRAIHPPWSGEGRAMRTADGDRQPHARTLLEAKIRERNMTLDEFAEYAEAFARENGETGTLSTRHLQRLTTGNATTPRPATRRLLERILGASVVELLGPPTVADSVSSRAHFTEWERGAAEISRLVVAAERVDQETIDLLAAQVENTRRLDRRFGAAPLLDALRLHSEHIEHLLSYTLDGATQRGLAVVLTDAHTLAGWQSLDRGEITRAWGHYRRACTAARTAESGALHAHALAEQAVVLSDVGHSTEAVQLSGYARLLATDGPPLLRSWLAAAHGEALAADDQPDASLRAFDAAYDLLPDVPGQLADGPYLALDAAHLIRWRGHALARFGSPDATILLRAALDQHDAEFTRAEAGLRTDLVLAYLALGEHDAARHELAAARRIADAVDSARQQRRLIHAAVALAS